ncbi:MAG: HAD hydrolase family protein [Acidaminococcaceae bacterium]|nr:HAD hydrolase family protein [Acidaminococcaceae bacterium]MBO6039035.1 HAD hydrolase family protein [Acidaminococcaceae bacterium]
MMLETLNPEYRFTSLIKITPEWMHRHHYRVLLTDIDNTLLPRDCSVVSEVYINWLARMQQQGVAVVLATNNGGKRTAAIHKQLMENGLNIPILTWAGKPFPRAYAGAIRLLGESLGADCADKAVQPSVVLAAGDQLFTDVLGAHWYNLPAAWLRPLSGNDFIGTKVLRILEKWVTWYLTKKDILPEEDADI